MNNNIYHTIIETPVGSLTVVGTERGVSGLYTARQSLPALSGERNDQALLYAVNQIQEYFRGERKQFSLELELQGTGFQAAVWKALRDIPFGTTVSYGQIAERIGRKSAVRAVGAAIGKNPVMIVVPCHRVIGANGSLTGFAGGLDCKRFLLNLERPRELV